MNPLITIAIPSFNQGRYLNDALASVFSRNLPVEVFVMDGGSSDTSLDVIRKWEPLLSGWRSRPDEGQSAAINEGIAMGSAPYVCWLNADDRFAENGLAHLLKGLASDSSSPAAYGWCWTILASGRKIVPYVTLPFHPWLLANYCFIAQPATLIRRHAWEAVGGIDQTLDMAMDYDLWWRLYNRFGKFAHVRRFAAHTRLHHDTKTASRREDHYAESMAVVLKHYGRIPCKWHLAQPVMITARSILHTIRN